MDFPSSFSTMRVNSTCDNSRSRPRMVPSTSRRYRSFSPSVISQSVITLLQIAIDVKRKNGKYVGRPDSTHRRRRQWRSEEHTSELQSPCNLVCRLLLEKKKKIERIPQPTPCEQLHCSVD